jgi:hypothetical protein
LRHRLFGKERLLKGGRDGLHVFAPDPEALDLIGEAFEFVSLRGGLVLVVFVDVPELVIHERGKIEVLPAALREEVTVDLVAVVGRKPDDIVGFAKVLDQARELDALAEDRTAARRAAGALPQIDDLEVQFADELQFVAMLDEDLFSFGLSLPHADKVRGRTCKKVLRAVADRWLPPGVAQKPKWGFGIPVDTWVDDEFKTRFRATVLGSSSGLDEFFRPEAYRPIVQAFCDGQPCQGISRQGVYQRAIMLLSLHLNLERMASSNASAALASH